MGGVPLVAATVLALALWAQLAAGEVFSFKGLSHTVLFALAMSVLGFWDDLSSLSPLFRFLVQMVGAGLFLFAGLGLFPMIDIEGVTIPQGVWLLAGTVWIVWMLNLYNFMDGIDGLAGGEAAVASSFFFLLFLHYGETGWAVANLFIAAASMGFLVHNWPPARVFMGDAGSAFLGAFFAMQSVLASLVTPVPLPVLVLPFANFILDATFTLFRRLRRRETWYRAHRSHFYQRMTDLGLSHSKVTWMELVSVVLSCVAAALYLQSGFTGRILTVFAVIAGFVAGGIWILRKERSLKYID
jgi:UDP-N-acetylmuramyl pentapeptide phosphotransferase/UDP-N-acetylglucosamine-1-phosphate transferase